MKRKSFVTILFVAGIFCFLVFQAQALVTLPEDGGVYGTWSPAHDVYTLIVDIEDNVQINCSDFTLDGGGHSITGTQGTGGDGNGVYLVYGLSSVTVTNLTVKYFDSGIYLFDCTLCTVIDNDLSTNHIGVHVKSGSNNVIEANTFIENPDDINVSSIKITDSNYNTIHNNTISGQAGSNNGIILEALSSSLGSSSNIITQNDVSNIPLGTGITLNKYCNNNTLECNNVHDNPYGITVLSSGNTLTSNTIENNAYGLFLYDTSCVDNTVTNNNFIENSSLQVCIYYAGLGNIINSNYYSDCVGSEYPIYDIDGILFTTDTSPLAVPSDNCGSTPPEPIQVDIDIKPESADNVVNLGSMGVIPVGILSTEDFDATQVDPWSVELAGAGVAVRGKGSKLLSSEKDLNGDGLMDLEVKVETENLDPGLFQDGAAILTGETYDGQEIQGADLITIVPAE